ncbi:MAG TPA: tetratricopeptide repeat protein [Sandaracinaceae bacterium LLY-WYZ-13_1]|nr:tetratricopeptide repeat protein [Sandaracinaceae bacterium LLY-WYZ-13_1]
MAQDDLERAREAFEQAEVEFDRGNHALALQGFQESYERMEGHPRRPLILFNIGRAYEELGRLEEARDAYQQYLHDAGSMAIEREETGARLRDLEARLTMGDEPSADTSTEGTADPPTGSENEGPTSGGISPVGPIVLGVGGAMLLGGAVTGGVALARRGEVLDMCTGMECPSSARDLASEVDALAVTTDVLLFGGGAVAVVGLVLTLVLTEDDEGDAHASVSCTGTGCIARYAGRFP